MVHRVESEGMPLAVDSDKRGALVLDIAVKMPTLSTAQLDRVGALLRGGRRRCGANTRAAPIGKSDSFEVEAALHLRLAQ